jgi:hypothetical protein
MDEFPDVIHTFPQIQLPRWLSSEAHSLIKTLLERNVSKRLGGGKSSMFVVKGVQALKRHPFFKVGRLRRDFTTDRVLTSGVTVVGGLGEDGKTSCSTAKSAQRLRRSGHEQF